MPLIRKYNTQPLEDRLLHEAVEAERGGDHDLAARKLHKAIHSDYYMGISKVCVGGSYLKYDLYPLDDELLAQWTLPEDINWSDTPDLQHMKYNMFGPNTAALARKRLSARRRKIVKTFKKKNVDTDKENNYGL